MVSLIGLAVVFLVLALVFYILGARGHAGFTMFAKWMVIIFVIFAIIIFLFGGVVFA